MSLSVAIRKRGHYAITHLPCVKTCYTSTGSWSRLPMSASVGARVPTIASHCDSTSIPQHSPWARIRKTTARILHKERNGDIAYSSSHSVWQRETWMSWAMRGDLMFHFWHKSTSFWKIFSDTRDLYSCVLGFLGSSRRWNLIDITTGICTKSERKALEPGSRVPWLREFGLTIIDQMSVTIKLNLWFLLLVSS